MSKQNNQLTVNLIQKINIGDINGIKKLITQGIDVNAIDNYGNTSLSVVFSNSSNRVKIF